MESLLVSTPAATADGLRFGNRQRLAAALQLVHARRGVRSAARSGMSTGCHGAKIQ
jgi:hypothetical protein